MSIVRTAFALLLLFSGLASAATADQPVEVELKSWNQAERSVELIFRGERRTIPLADNVRVIVNGEDANLSTMPANRPASVVFDKATAAITSIEIVSVKDKPAAMAALNRSGAHIRRDASGNVVEVTSRMVKDRSKMTDAWLASVDWQGLPYVTVVGLNFTPVTDAGLRHLEKVQRLQDLSERGEDYQQEF
ncbi:hypothetical protein [Stieleria varia]|uniref:DUF4412 domain-containing protein n=1 Tax=Stieleria varia TaxID=2528005 RepID=A0A5C6AY17_9BACT|nr:hypothetical protein [Stieleria varia]TWU04823.1 hypothetical protein Pla52n_28670 [Stieleria varia]